MRDVTRKRQTELCILTDDEIIAFPISTLAEKSRLDFGRKPPQSANAFFFFVTSASDSMKRFDFRDNTHLLSETARSLMSLARALSCSCSGCNRPFGVEQHDQICAFTLCLVLGNMNRFFQNAAISYNVVIITRQHCYIGITLGNRDAKRTKTTC